MANAIPDKVTIYDVARSAGVSIATVSHTLNRPERVSARTRLKVLEAVDELKFVPKASAVSQARRGVGRVGVLAPFSSYQSYFNRLVGVMQGCETQALEVVVFDQPSAAEVANPLLSSIPTTGRLDGLIVMGLPLDESMATRLLDRGLPTVLVDSSYPGFSSVNVDDVAGGYMVGKHLIDGGRRRFAFVAEGQKSSEYLSAGQMRYRGLTRALKDAGVRRSEVLSVVTSKDIDGGRAAAQEILAGNTGVDAVFALHDLIAAGVVDGVRRAGRQVPQEVAVAGYDGSALSEVMAITSVHQPFEETGVKAASLLHGLLTGEETTAQSIILLPHLQIRSSTQ